METTQVVAQKPHDVNNDITCRKLKHAQYTPLYEIQLKFRSQDQDGLVYNTT